MKRERESLNSSGVLDGVGNFSMKIGQNSSFSKMTVILL